MTLSLSSFCSIKFVVFLALLLAIHSSERSVMVSGQCQGDMQGLMQQCARFVQKSGPKSQPSPGCCGVVKNVDLACVCHHITGDVENIISMEKAAYVAQACGKPLHHGTKCGSYTVP